MDRQRSHITGLKNAAEDRRNVVGSSKRRRANSEDEIEFYQMGKNVMADQRERLVRAEKHASELDNKLNEMNLKNRLLKDQIMKKEKANANYKATIQDLNNRLHGGSSEPVTPPPGYNTAFAATTAASDPFANPAEVQAQKTLEFVRSLQRDLIERDKTISGLQLVRDESDLTLRELTAELQKVRTQMDAAEKRAAELQEIADEQQTLIDRLVDSG